MKKPPTDLSSVGGITMRFYLRFFLENRRIPRTVLCINQPCNQADDGSFTRAVFADEAVYITASDIHCNTV